MFLRANNAPFVAGITNQIRGFTAPVPVETPCPIIGTECPELDMNFKINIPIPNLRMDLNNDVYVIPRNNENDIKFCIDWIDRKFIRKSDQGLMNFGDVYLFEHESNFGYNHVFLKTTHELLQSDTILTDKIDINSDCQLNNGMPIMLDWMKDENINWNSQHTSTTRWIKLLAEVEHNPYDKTDSENIFGDRPHYVVHSMSLAGGGLTEMIEFTRIPNDNTMYKGGFVEKYFVPYLLYIFSTTEICPEYRFKWFTSEHDISLYNRLYAFRGKGTFLIDKILAIDINNTETLGINNPEDKELLISIKQRFLFLQIILKNMRQNSEKYNYVRLFDLIFIIMNITWSIEYRNKLVKYNPGRFRKFELLTYNLGLVNANYNGETINFSDNFRAVQDRELGYVVQLIRTIPFVQTSFEYKLEPNSKSNLIPSPYFIMIKDPHRCPTNNLDLINVADFIRKDNKKFQWTVSINYHVPWHRRDLKRRTNIQRGPIFYREYVKKIQPNDNQIMTKKEWAYTFGRAFTFSHDNKLLWLNQRYYSYHNKPIIYSPQTLTVRDDLFQTDVRHARGNGPFKYGTDEWLSTYFVYDTLNRNIYKAKKDLQDKKPCVDKTLIHMYDKSDFFQMYYGWDCNFFNANCGLGTKEYRSGAFLLLFYICIRSYEIYGRYFIPNSYSIRDFPANTYYDLFNFSAADFIYYVDTVLRDDNNPRTDAIKYATMYFPSRLHIHNFAGNSHENATIAYKKFVEQSDWTTVFSSLLYRATFLFMGCFKNFLLDEQDENSHYSCINAILGFPNTYNSDRLNHEYGIYVKKIIEGNVLSRDAQKVCDINRNGGVDIDELNKISRLLGTSNNYNTVLMLVDSVDNHYSITGCSHETFSQAVKWYDNDIGNDVQYPLNNTGLTGGVLEKQKFENKVSSNSKDIEPTMNDEFLQIAKETNYEKLQELIKKYYESIRDYKYSISVKHWEDFFRSIDKYTLDDFIEPLNKEIKDKFRQNLLGYFTKNNITIETFSGVTQDDIDKYVEEKNRDILSKIPEINYEPLPSELFEKMTIDSINLEPLKSNVIDISKYSHYLKPTEPPPPSFNSSYEKISPISSNIATPNPSDSKNMSNMLPLKKVNIFPRDVPKHAFESSFGNQNQLLGYGGDVLNKNSHKKITKKNKGKKTNRKRNHNRNKSLKKRKTVKK
jgi:hypothetical protein